MHKKIRKYFLFSVVFAGFGVGHALVGEFISGTIMMILSIISTYMVEIYQNNLDNQSGS